MTRQVTTATDAPAIVILTPACNADIAAGSGLRVTGTASVFEAALRLELRNADRQELRRSAGSRLRRLLAGSAALLTARSGTRNP